MNNNRRELTEAEKTELSKAAKQAICVCLIGSGLYSIYSVRLERNVSTRITRNSAYFLAALAIGFGSWKLGKEYLLQQRLPVENNQDEKLHYSEKL